MSNLKFWFPGILGDVKMLKKLKKSNSVKGKIRNLRFSLSVTLNLEFSLVKSIFQPICLMNIPNGLKRSCLATKILKIQAVENKCQIGNFRKIATILVPQWLIFKSCQFGTSFLLHGFLKEDRDIFPSRVIFDWSRASFELSPLDLAQSHLLESYERILGQICKIWSLTLPTLPLKKSQKRQK